MTIGQYCFTQHSVESTQIKENISTKQENNIIFFVTVIIIKAQSPNSLSISSAPAGPHKQREATPLA